jgi:hypothetical protein
MLKEFVEMIQRDHGRRAFKMLLVLSLLPIHPSPCAAAVNIQVMPNLIQVGTFFDGTRVKATAEISRGSDAVIEVVGKETGEQLLRKGRFWVIWMNMGEIDVEGAPCLYLAMSTKPGSLSQAGVDAPCGYNVLQKRVSFSGGVGGFSRSKIMKEFIKLKESEKLYGVFPGALKVSHPVDGDRSVVQGTFTIPSRVAPGTYWVRLSVIRNGRMVKSESVPLEIRMVSMPALLSSLAYEHGALYGLLAIVVAVFFGYFTGVVFKRTRGGH